MSKGSRSTWLLGACATAALVVASQPCQAQAPRTASFNIAEGEMRPAIDTWMRQSGREVIYRVEDVQGLRTRGVSGVMDSDLALERTLAGSGLTSRRDTSGALAIIRQSDARSQAETGLVATQIEDVIVTARRTEERSQDVPVAVSAFSQESLREKGIQTATDLQNFTPSLTVLGHVSRNQEEFTLRGMGGSGGFGTGSGPGVVAYFAETPNSASGPGVFYDLQSLQVLKGPQGTLFGRNSTGGAVLIEPRRPDYSGLNGYAEGIVGNFSRRSGEAAINLPLIEDRLAVRLAARFDQREGYARDVLSGREYLNRDNWGVRLGIRFDPTPWFSNYTVASYNEVNENGGGTVLLAVNPASTFGSLMTPFLAAQQSRSVRETALSTITKDELKTFLFLNNSEFRLRDGLTLKNIISYAGRQGNTASDGDASPLEISDLVGALPGSYNTDLRTFTEEVQLRYETDRFDVQVGAFYLKEDTPDDGLTFQTINPLQAPLGIAATTVILPFSPFFYPVLSVQDRAEVHGDSRAVYAQTNVNLTSSLTATAGLRWTWDTYGGHISSYLPASSFSNFVANAPPALLPTALLTQALASDLCVYDAFLAVARGQTPSVRFPNCSYPGFEGESDGATWQLGLDWRADPDTLVYVVSRRGYKSGGTNPVVTILSPLGQDDPLFPFKPETVTDLELGLKRDWSWDNGVSARTNIAAFYTWYDDIQVIQRQVFIGSDIATNAQKAHVLGVEFEGLLKFGDRFALGATYSYNSAEYDEWQTLATPGSPSQDYSGTPFLYVPSSKFSLDGRLALPMPVELGDLGLRVTYSWQDDLKVSPDPQPFDTIPSYALVNLRLEWDNVGGRPIDIALYGTNVTDEEYRVTSNNAYTTSGRVSSIYGEPAQYGLSVRARY